VDRSAGERGGPETVNEDDRRETSGRRRDRQEEGAGRPTEFSGGNGSGGRRR